MSSTTPGPRPREVTIGGWAIPVASAVLVVAVFDRMAGLRSVATRDALTTALSSGWAEGLGVSVDDAIGLIRAALFVAGTAAAITGILGIFVLQRHASARLALTVAAVPVVLTAPVVGGLLGIIIGISTGLLWTRPARDWFAGRPPAPRAATAHPSGPVPPVSERPGPPPPTQAWGRPPGAAESGQGQPAPPAYPVAYPARYPAPHPAQGYPSSPPQHTAADQMPTQVRIACILTWIFSLLTGGIYLVLILVVAVDRGAVIDVLQDNSSVRDASLTDAQLIGIVVAMSAVVLMWCLAASVLAFFTWRRHVWAWIMLLVSVGFAGLFELLALPFSLLHLAACVTAFVLLLRAPVRSWIRGDVRSRQPPSWPGNPPGSAPAAPWQPPAQPPVQPPVQPPGKPPVW